mgnify:CR=1 FL=1
MPTAAVHGLAITGRAVTAALVRHGWHVRVSDDNATEGHRDFASSIGASFVDVSADGGLSALLDGADILLPAPGVPPRSRVIKDAQSRGIAVRSEIDVAHDWERAGTDGARPILAVTGTDGKTTTTMLTAALLRGAGIRAEEVGNTDVPFMEAVDDATIHAFVVECSSFRLRFTDSFRADASVWLNFAPDHLDWHPDLDDYRASKERIWAHAREEDVAVAPTAAPMILEAARRSRARVVTFGHEGADYRVEKGNLVSPHGVLCAVGDLWRSMPHDITNSLAAAALVLETGAVPLASIGESLASFRPAHHRIELVGSFEGVEWYDDSKATSPHAAGTAIRAFERVVLIAGGRNKDLDLRDMVCAPERMHAVVAIGEDAKAIEAAFRGICPVDVATDMATAVSLAAGRAEHGVTVLLSPGCTSYDWYANYGERGEDFQAKVRAHFAGEVA